LILQLFCFLLFLENNEKEEIKVGNINKKEKFGVGRPGR